MRKKAYEQRELVDLYKVREIAYHAYISNNVQFKTSIPTKQQFMPLEKEVKRYSGVSPAARNNFIKEVEKWKELSSKLAQTSPTSKKG